jgi:hypothetical protein
MLALRGARRRPCGSAPLPAALFPAPPSPSDLVPAPPPVADPPLVADPPPAADPPPGLPAPAPAPAFGGHGRSDDRDRGGAPGWPVEPA